MTQAEVSRNAEELGGAADVQPPQAVSGAQDDSCEELTPTNSTTRIGRRHSSVRLLPSQNLDVNLINGSQAQNLARPRSARQNGSFLNLWQPRSGLMPGMPGMPGPPPGAVPSLPFGSRPSGGPPPPSMPHNFTATSQPTQQRQQQAPQTTTAAQVQSFPPASSPLKQGPPLPTTSQPLRGQLKRRHTTADNCFPPAVPPTSPSRPHSAGTTPTSTGSRRDIQEAEPLASSHAVWSPHSLTHPPSARHLPIATRAAGDVGAARVASKTGSTTTKAEGQPRPTRAPTLPAVVSSQLKTQGATQRQRGSIDEKGSGRRHASSFSTAPSSGSQPTAAKKVDKGHRRPGQRRGRRAPPSKPHETPPVKRLSAVEEVPRVWTPSSDSDGESDAATQTPTHKKRWSGSSWLRHTFFSRRGSGADRSEEASNRSLSSSSSASSWTSSDSQDDARSSVDPERERRSGRTSASLYADSDSRSPSSPLEQHSAHLTDKADAIRPSVSPANTEFMTAWPSLYCSMPPRQLGWPPGLLYPQLVPNGPSQPLHAYPGNIPHGNLVAQSPAPTAHHAADVSNSALLFAQQAAQVRQQTSLIARQSIDGTGAYTSMLTRYPSVIMPYYPNAVS